MLDSVVADKSTPDVSGARMCKYCNYAMDGWTALLEYDEVYQRTVVDARGDRYGFHESWDELREELRG